MSLIDEVWILYQIHRWNSTFCDSCENEIGLNDSTEMLGIYTSEDEAMKERDRLIKDYTRRLEDFEIKRIELNKRV